MLKYQGISVEYLTHMGSDLMVVNAARVSFNKQSTYDDDGKLKEADEKLIRYLARHNHISPFFHPTLQVRVSAPIFVARQLLRHQVGFAINEISRRYVDEPPQFYMPEKWRKRDPNVKQGSKQDEFVTHLDSSGTVDVNERVSDFFQESAKLYGELLDSGVAPEMARMVLPQAMMTQWIWSGSLFAWARLCRERLHPAAQREVRIDFAQRISDIMYDKFPVSWRYLVLEWEKSD